MLPSKTLNIYTKNDENIKALIEFYFNKYDVNQENALAVIKEKTSLELNQIEFILKKISEAYTSIFRKHLNRKITLTNLFTYGIDALESETINKGGSKNRQMITQEFKDFVKQTEIDFTYPKEKN